MPLPAYIPIAFNDYDETDPISSPPGGTFDFEAYDRNKNALTPPAIPDLPERSPQGNLYLQGSNVPGAVPAREERAAQELALGGDDAARQFLGMQKYRNVLASGGNYAQAIQEAAPLLFGKSPNNLYKSLTIPPPNTLPATLQARPVMGYGGKPIANAIINSRGEIQSTIPDRPEHETLTQADKNAQAVLDAKIRVAIKKLATPEIAIQAPLAAKAQQELDDLLAQRQSIGIKAPAAVASPTQKISEVTKTLKNGKKAVFNADTREFIRYAQ